MDNCSQNINVGGQDIDRDIFRYKFPEIILVGDQREFESIFRGDLCGPMTQAAYCGSDEDDISCELCNSPTRTTPQLKQHDGVVPQGITVATMGDAKSRIIAVDHLTSFVNNILSESTTTELAFLLPSAFIAGLARGFSGFGAALIFMPLASAVIGPQEAAPLLLIIDAIMVVGLIPEAWRRADRCGVTTMAAGAMVGVPVGTFALALANPLMVRWAIVLVVALLLVLLVSGWRYRGYPSPLLNVAVGVLSGLIAGSAGVGGPPVVAYWLGRPAPAVVVRASISLYFVIVSGLSFISYLMAGLFVHGLLFFASATGPLYGLGLYTGSRLFKGSNDVTFKWVCYGIITLATIVGLPVFDSVMR